MFSRRSNDSRTLPLLATDAISANVMVTDAALNIVYMNKAVRALLDNAEQDIRKDLPNFRTATLIGNNIDAFHKNPARQRAMLAALKTPHHATIHIGGRVFDLIATPLTNAQDRRAGFVVEWADAAVRLQNIEFKAQADAISRTQAVVEFRMDGTVVTANDHFLKAVGYRLDEIRNKHHSLFVERHERDSAAYRDFWAALNRGDYQSGEYKRLAKGEREIWLLGSYNPVLDQNGKPFKVVKFATDITSEKIRTSDLEGQIAAIGKSQAVIEFDMQGRVLRANDNFLKALGYALNDIVGKPHSMFVSPSERDTPRYRDFWAALNRGEYQAGEFKRIGKNGREVWIQASYNPILDCNGRPFKVVKYATDTTAQVIARLKNEHICGMLNQVASGAEELNASVRDISEAMLKSKETAGTAAEHVEAADGQALRLGSAAEAMTGIVGLIGEITGQINLLALNATIESARAGEAGRGFAVVASEVKTLANQAKHATDKIAAEIESLNGIAGDVIGALAAIKHSMQSVNEYVASTAAAVEEQSTVAAEMSAAMQRAATEAASLG